MDRNELNECRNMCLEIDKSELDMMKKVHLFYHIYNSSETPACQETQDQSLGKGKTSLSFLISGIQVCTETLASVHGISRKTIDSNDFIAGSLDQDGFLAKVHGNKGSSLKQPYQWVM